MKRGKWEKEKIEKQKIKIEKKRKKVKKTPSLKKNFVPTLEKKKTYTSGRDASLPIKKKKKHEPKWVSRL